MRTRERTAPYDSLPVESKPVGLFFHSKVSNFPLNFKFVSFFFQGRIALRLRFDSAAASQTRSG